MFGALDTLPSPPLLPLSAAEKVSGGRSIGVEDSRWENGSKDSMGLVQVGGEGPEQIGDHSSTAYRSTGDMMFPLPRLWGLVCSVPARVVGTNAHAVESALGVGPAAVVACPYQCPRPWPAEVNRRWCFDAGSLWSSPMTIG